MSATEQKVTFHSAASTTANGTVMNTGQTASVLVQITGTFSASVAFQGTIDGSNWVAIQGANVNSGAVATTATAAGLYLVPVVGMRLFRCDLTWASGTSITAAGIGTSLESGLDLANVDIDSSEVLAVSSAGDTISQTPTVTAGAYAANDAVGGLLTFANAARTTGGGGVVLSVQIIDDAGQDAELELWLFSETFTAMVDNAAWAPSEADLRKVRAVASTGDGSWRAAGTPSVATIEVSQRYDVTDTSLFGQLVNRTAGTTFAATDDVTAVVGLLQD